MCPRHPGSHQRYRAQSEDLAGNAVTPPAARDPVACMAETLEAF